MKKLNNKVLLIVLGVLVAAFVIVRVFRAPALESNLKKELTSVDTSKVTLIKLWPEAESGKEIQFTRNGNKWSIKKDNKEYNLEQGAASSLMSYLVKMVPQKMVTRKKEKWSDFQVGDSATHVQVFAGTDNVADLRIGKIGFSQADIQRMQQQQQFGQGGFGGGYTYVRIDGEDEVYTVDGLITSSFNRSLNDWRDKSLLRIKKDQVTKISFNYPDSGFVADKREKKWWIGNQMADSTKFKNYLSQLEYKNASSFADDFNPNRQPDLTLNIDGAAGPLATLQAWKRETDWVVTSTHQSGVYFSTQGSGIYNTVFERSTNLLMK